MPLCIAAGFILLPTGDPLGASQLRVSLAVKYGAVDNLRGGPHSRVSTNVYTSSKMWLGLVQIPQRQELGIWQIPTQKSWGRKGFKLLLEITL
ncbi:hypothetical protein J6590_043056 [Homalodisca vitripennis]|nr:hypothetical protein J6590_043056 [Homalodisca vitripennis]